MVQTFSVADACLVHRDGKIMQIKKVKKSDRCCVLISGTNSEGETVTKLLGVPEIPSGTGAAQEKAVTSKLQQWNVQDGIVGIVFDTTASNTGQWRGACTMIEQELKRGILWLACRHHIYELHIKHVSEKVTGSTKDPGVALFKRLKTSWSSLHIDMDQLTTFDHHASDAALQRCALEVLAWANTIVDKTWPRDDYKELIELIIVWLGGHVRNFNFKMPGADHHARWMSKAIYFMKLAIIEKQFEMSDSEKNQVQKMAEFIGLFYGEAFIKAPLSSSAAANDVRFMTFMQMYSQYQPDIAKAAMDSAKRHLWYLTPQLLPMCLVDNEMEVQIREQIARKLSEVDRPHTFVPKKTTTFPQFPKENGSEVFVIGDFLVNE